MATAATEILIELCSHITKQNKVKSAYEPSGSSGRSLSRFP